MKFAICDDILTNGCTTMTIFLASPLTSILRLASTSSPALSRLFQDDETVPGATEGILMLGILIVLIIIVPIIWERRKWMR